ncbi:MAG: GNAT family N-acetyltransferase [Lachnospiraceae bacterium]|nr:GNAT family N-acetyltransferase [Lachnospiraceae bacterium]
MDYKVNMNIRLMTPKDKEEVLKMMRVFYDSDAVQHAAPDAILEKDIDDCVSTLPFVEGYILEENGKIAGYSMIAFSYSTEYGGICIWIEDIYIKPEYQGRGFATKLFRFIEEKYNNIAVRYRLELEKNNVHAKKSYQKNGYAPLDYLEMTKEL